MLQKDVFHKCYFFRLLIQPTNAQLSPSLPEYTAFMGSAVMVLMADISRDQIWMRPVLSRQIREQVVYTGNTPWITWHVNSS